jgi:LPXTG-motif cell wall-anchored protein
MAAAAITRVPLGVAISDDDGNVEDDVEIPEDTRSGSYRIVVEGPNPRRGTNTVTIPIKVAAETDDSGSSGAPGSATDTATQASPSATTGGGAGGVPTLPQTGSQSLQSIFALGVLALVLGGSLLGARRIAGRQPAGAMATATATGPVITAMVPRPVRTASEAPNQLRGEMQRLLARGTDRDDPDRDADL